MKTLKIKPDTFKIDGLTEKINQHFGSKYSVTNNHRNEITIAKDKTIGCKLILTKKRLIINGTFPTISSLMMAVGILIVGGIVIPMAVYLFAYKPKFEAIEKEVYDFIRLEFPDSLS
ncbi:MAG: hypothetical protein M0D53_06235 [Flavobacterium sp. JAD_PAG50586_2]|nr:MAG: hypothetical protein M0D53_06235 [Flavobacterium sp. JAD_PAG50586_2]